MNINVGKTDRIVRAILGLVLIALPFTNLLPILTTGWAAALSIILGLVMLTVAVIRICPIYSIFGLSSCGK